MKKTLFVLIFPAVLFSCSSEHKKIIKEYSNISWAVYDSSSSGEKMLHEITEDAMQYPEELDYMVQNNLDTLRIDDNKKLKSYPVLFLDKGDNIIDVTEEVRSEKTN